MADTKQIPGGTIERSVYPPKKEGDADRDVTCFYAYEIVTRDNVTIHLSSWLGTTLYKQAEQIEALRAVAAASMGDLADDQQACEKWRAALAKAREIGALE
jgi:chromosome condensin MukBEF MukE localization factor